MNLLVLVAGQPPRSIVIAASGYRIESTGMQRVAFQQPAGCEIRAFQEAVTADGFQGIFGTGRMKTAAGT